MSFSLSSFLDCINQRGKGTFGGMEQERNEFGTTFLELDGGVAGVVAAIGLEMIGCCGKASSRLAMAESSSSSSDNIYSSISRLCLDICGSAPTSIPLQHSMIQNHHKSILMDYFCQPTILF
ncbi:hypothetical protein ACFX1T_040002 [Malus domestica]